MGRMTLVLIVALLMAAIPTATQAAAQTSCLGFDHHDINSPWLPRLFGADAQIYGNSWTGDVFLVVWVAECGRYLLGIWRGGRFTTHFYPKAFDSIAVAWDYIWRQVTNAKAVPMTWGQVVRDGWQRITIRSAFVAPILLPCPGTWDRFERPCTEGTIQ